MLLLDIVSMGGSGCTAVAEDDSDEPRSSGGLSATNELGRTGSDALAYSLMLTWSIRWISRSQGFRGEGILDDSR